MKKSISFIISLVMVVSVIFTGCSQGSAPSGNTPQGGAGSQTEEAWAPSQNVEFVVTSSAGGGSDIFARTITDIMTREGICTETFLVNNQTAGNGEVGRLTVSQTKGNKADHTLLSMNSGDFMDMVDNTENRIENFRPIAVMAVDKQLLFTGENPKFADFNAVIDALSKGESVIMGGSKGSDVATFEALIKELGVEDTLFKYIAYDSTSEAITAILGNHVDMVIAKPAASLQYVEAGSLIPILALSDERFPDSLADAPTLSEIGDYGDVQVPVWRSVVAPKEMSDEAVAYWSNALKKVSESDAWINDYLAKNALIGDYRTYEDTTAYITQFQNDYIGK